MDKNFTLQVVAGVIGSLVATGGLRIMGGYPEYAWIPMVAVLIWQYWGLNKRINRTEWDWADLKRLRPDIVKDFPHRD